MVICSRREQVLKLMQDSDSSEASSSDFESSFSNSANWGSGSEREEECK